MKTAIDSHKTQAPIGLFVCPGFAPCSFLLVKLSKSGHAVSDWRNNTSNSILIQNDWDFPSIASAFGWNGKLDGSVNEIATAGYWLQHNATNLNYSDEPERIFDDADYGFFPSA